MAFRTGHSTGGNATEGVPYRAREGLGAGNRSLSVVTQRVLDFEVVQFCPQIGERRFRSLVPIHSSRLQAITTGAARDIN